MNWPKQKSDAELNFDMAVKSYKEALREQIEDTSAADEAIVALDELLKGARALGKLQGESLQKPN